MDISASLAGNSPQNSAGQEFWVTSPNPLHAGILGDPLKPHHAGMLGDPVRVGLKIA